MPITITLTEQEAKAIASILAKLAKHNRSPKVIQQISKAESRANAEVLLLKHLPSISPYLKNTRS